MNTFEGIRYPIDSAEINKHQIGFSLFAYKMKMNAMSRRGKRSVTYKLKLNGGDIKAVQGDSRHSQINMVTDVYSHIIDDDRRKNAEL